MYCEAVTAKLLIQVRCLSEGSFKRYFAGVWLAVVFSDEQTVKVKTFLTRRSGYSMSVQLMQQKSASLLRMQHLS